MISYDEALAHLRALARPTRAEHVSLTEAHRRVLSEPVVAMVTAPPTDVSAMDGYAVFESDVASLPARLAVVGESFAGSAYLGELHPGQCVRIFTGAQLPKRADRVIIQEVVTREGDFAVLETSPGESRHVRKAGSDFDQGDVLLGEGTCLGPRQLVAAAAADLKRLPVWRRPSLTVLGTGDELVEPGQARYCEGTIPESVSFGVAAMAEEWGAAFIGRVRLADDLQTMEKAAESALAQADIIVVTGGASVGEKDFAKQMFQRQGLELLFSKVAIKPGKPVWLGRAAGKIVLGLPGNPTSALVTARLFLAPLLAGLAGRGMDAALRWRPASLISARPAEVSRETFARGFAVEDKVELGENQDSSAQKALASCNALVRLRPGTSANQSVEVLDF